MFSKISSQIFFNINSNYKKWLQTYKVTVIIKKIVAKEEYWIHFFLSLHLNVYTTLSTQITQWINDHNLLATSRIWLFEYLLCCLCIICLCCARYVTVRQSTLASCRLAGGPPDKGAQGQLLPMPPCESALMVSGTTSKNFRSLRWKLCPCHAFEVHASSA